MVGRANATSIVCFIKKFSPAILHCLILLSLETIYWSWQCHNMGEACVHVSLASFEPETSCSPPYLSSNQFWVLFILSPKSLSVHWFSPIWTATTLSTLSARPLHWCPSIQGSLGPSWVRMMKFQKCKTDLFKTFQWFPSALRGKAQHFAGYIRPPMAYACIPLQSILLPALSVGQDNKLFLAIAMCQLYFASRSPHMPIPLPQILAKSFSFFR